MRFLPRSPRPECPLAARALLAACCVLAGCAADTKVRADPAIAGAVLATVARQARVCYRSPRVPHSARQITTRLAIRLNPDGSLASLPRVIGQAGVSPDNTAYAERMAQAAGNAVVRCAPFRLPPEHHRAIWREFELMFSPARRA